MAGIEQDGGVLVGVFSALLFCCGSLPAAAEVPTPPTGLSFSDFFVAGSAPLTPSSKLLALHGRRVRIAGFMARAESPRAGSFYLCPRPVLLAEDGAGTGDLPPVAVLVTVPGSAGRAVPFVNRRLQVAGVLDVGYREDSRGEVSWVRLTTDPASGSKEE